MQILDSHTADKEVFLIEIECKQVWLHGEDFRASNTLIRFKRGLHFKIPSITGLKL